jgi:hypothetical protein
MALVSIRHYLITSNDVLQHPSRKGLAVISGGQSVKSAFVSVIVKPTHRRNFRDRTASFRPTDVNQEVYGAPDVRHDRPVR